MTLTIWRHDVIAWAVQVALIVGASAALSRLFRVQHPRASLAWWRLILAACLLLPFCQPWILAPSSSSLLSARTPLAADAIVVSGVASLSESASRASSSGPWTIDALLLTVLGIGVVARGIWLIVGAWALHRLRRAATPIDPLPRVWAEAQARIGVRARLFVSDGVDGPITFGVLRPVVIVPPSLSTMPEAVQQAIAFHELLHVQRRDWIDTIAEEIVRAACWFHPAVWWLIGRIRISREQVVDRAAIALTDSRESYIDALLAVARSRLPRVLVPAAPFLRRTALKERVASILQETTMTTRRLIASLTASAAVLTLTAAMAVRAFPLKAEEPRVKTTASGTQADADASAPVQIVRGGEHLLHGMTPEYPKRAAENRAEGNVVLDLTLDERGEVSDAHVVSGPDEFRRAALESVLHWHYSPDALRSTAVQVELRFQAPTGNAQDRGPEAAIGFAREKAEKESGMTRVRQYEHMLLEIESGLQRPDLTDSEREELKKKGAEARARLEDIRRERGERPIERNGERTADTRLARVWTERVPRETVTELMSRAGISVGDPITEDTARRIRQVAATLDEHLRVVLRPADGGGLMLVLLAP